MVCPVSCQQRLFSHPNFKVFLVTSGLILTVSAVAFFIFGIGGNAGYAPWWGLTANQSYAATAFFGIAGICLLGVAKCLKKAEPQRDYRETSEEQRVNLNRTVQRGQNRIKEIEEKRKQAIVLNKRDFSNRCSQVSLLPDELLAYTSFGLSIKDLRSCLCTCKKWYSLIVEHPFFNLAFTAYSFLSLSFRPVCFDTEKNLALVEDSLKGDLIIRDYQTNQTIAGLSLGSSDWPFSHYACGDGYVVPFYDSAKVQVVSYDAQLNKTGEYFFSKESLFLSHENDFFVLETEDQQSYRLSNLKNTTILNFSIEKQEIRKFEKHQDLLFLANHKGEIVVVEKEVERGRFCAVEHPDDRITALYCAQDILISFSYRGEVRKWMIAKEGSLHLFSREFQEAGDVRIVCKKKGVLFGFLNLINGSESFRAWTL